MCKVCVCGVCECVVKHCWVSRGYWKYVMMWIPRATAVSGLNPILLTHLGLLLELVVDKPTVFYRYASLLEL